MDHYEMKSCAQLAGASRFATLSVSWKWRQ